MGMAFVDRKQNRVKAEEIESEIEKREKYQITIKSEFRSRKKFPFDFEGNIFYLS